MRILQVNKYFSIKGGADRSFMQTLKVLADHGHEVIPFASRGPGDVESEHSSFFFDDLIRRQPWSVVDQARIFARGIYNLEAQQSLDELIAATKPEIAHLHNIHYQISPSILHTLRQHEIPVVMTLRDYRIICPNGYLFTQGALCERCKGGRFHNAFLYRCLRDSWRASFLGGTAAYVHRALDVYKLVDRLIAPSQFLLNKMVEFGYEADRLVHIPNFIDAESFEPRFEGDPYLVWAGRMVPQKGPQVALGAMRRLTGGDLYLAGEGPYLPAIQREAMEERLAERVTLSGFLEGPDLWSLLRDARALVFPSVWNEVFGMVALEAYALGKPVIASRIGGIQEIVRDGETGFLVEPGDVEGFAQAMETLLDDPAKTADMGRRARQFVADEFSPELHYSRLASLYEDVVRASQNRTGRSQARREAGRHGDGPAGNESARESERTETGAQKL